MYKGFSGLIDDAGNVLKSVVGSIKTKVVSIFESVGGFVSGLWGKITNSTVYKGFSGLIDDAISSISKFFSGIASKIGSVVSAVMGGVSSILPGGTKPVVEAVKASSKPAQKASEGGLKSVIGKVVSKGVNIGKSIGSGAVAVGKSIGSGAVAVGKAGVGLTAGAAKSAITSSAKGIIKTAGGMTNLLGKVVPKIPIIGPAISGAIALYDIKGMREKLARGEITEPQLQQDAGKRVISAVGDVIGASGGSVLGAAIGAIPPLTVLGGPFWGAIAGGVLGSLAGDFLGGIVSDYIIPKQYVKTIGAYVTGTTPPKDEMQDFIIKDGKVHKFNNKDELMGLKSGGAINEFLKGGNNNTGMEYLIRANHLANQYLKAIAQNTAIMARGNAQSNSGGSGGNVTVVQQSPQQQQRQIVSIPNNRDGYLSSPYALA